MLTHFVYIHLYKVYNMYASNEYPDDTAQTPFLAKTLHQALIMKTFQILPRSNIARGDRDSRANLMPIYGDLYQIKLYGITNENHLVTHLGFTSGRHYDVIRITYIVSVLFKRYAHCSLWRSGLSCILFANFGRNAPN